MSIFQDGPASALFDVLPLAGSVPFSRFMDTPVSDHMRAAAAAAPVGDCVGWGIPFEIHDPLVLIDVPVTVEFDHIKAKQLVFMHASDLRDIKPSASGFITASRGRGQLAEVAANYHILYADGSQVSVPIVRRHQIGAFTRGWGENCFQAVAHHKPNPLRASHEQMTQDWGRSQTRAEVADQSLWTNWLWSWENPEPDLEITGIRFEPVCGVTVVSAITAGHTSSNPLRWRPRQKALLALSDGDTFQPELDAHGLLAQIQLDLGQVISALPRLVYPNEIWADTYNNKLPLQSANQVVIEYSSHPDARFHLSHAASIPVSNVESHRVPTFQAISAARQRVTIRVVERGSTTAVPVKLHIHGLTGETLAPVDRHRIPNPAWFEDYSVDFSHRRIHHSTYIPGETSVDLPLGKVFIEISKGFEVQPVRKVIEIDADTRDITVELDRVLHWRDKGWVTADTHVHFLSPVTALLEGSAEGVNVINLLASQWGELMTNVGDFDGKNTWGAKDTGGDGEYLVRVGTENRQHVLGHISLLGYNGRIIAPMTTGGPDESALGDPIEILLSEWARQCKQQGGLVVLPHFPNPRAEHAAAIVNGDIDALEMTSWEDLYSGIDPYSLADWYRYLNCGYLVAACGGTDKMSAETAVGTVRTYAHIATNTDFSYATWMDAIRRGETFVTYGPLLDFMVNGKPMGSRIELPADGATLDVTWQCSSITIPLSRVELVVNGEIRESISTPSYQAAGQWSVHVDHSSWLALLVRGKYSDRPEVIAAHSSPVMVTLAGSPLLAAADAVTILDQIEGAIAYLDTVGTRAEDEAYKRMRLALQSSHRTLHNRLHQLGYYHEHTTVADHSEHH